MQKGQEIDRDMLVLLLVVLGVGIVIGLIVAPRGKKESRVDKNRANANFVFGNIVIGSNNGSDNRMSFGQDTDGDNR